MKFHWLLLAILLVFESVLVIPTRAQESSSSKSHTTGTLKGVVWDGDGEFPGSWTVVIERGSSSQEILADDHGRFETKLSPGDYTAYIKPTTPRITEKLRRIPFRVQAGETVEVELDPTSEYVFCSSKGERVIPIRMTDMEDDKVKDLRRPKVDTFILKRPNDDSLKVTVEYCGKSQLNEWVRYKSAVITYRPVSIFTPDAELDLRRYTVEGWGNVYVVSAGKRIKTPHFKADLGGGNVTSMSSSESRTRKPR